ncbi:MAG: CDP-alcohol phosphatidyltransferase family protein [Lachnospirales bacterium]
MLDTKAREHVQPIFDKVANFFINRKISATKVTILALIVGIIASLFLFFEYKYLALAFLWISGFLDVLDGTIARKTSSKTKLGGFLDIIFDRIVEIGIIFALCLLNKELSLCCVFLLGAIIMSMTIFLTSGALIDKDSSKAFYYQTGLAERTEGFIMLSLAMIFETFAMIFLVIFACIVYFTAIQRFVETVKYLK